MSGISSPNEAPALAAFLGSLVEFVEALTIVLAVGSVRGWRPALLGAGSALAVLLLAVLLVGGSLAALPLAPLRLVIGALTLLFGLRWLRKAILRYGGYIPLNDETRRYARASARLRDARATGRSGTGAMLPADVAVDPIAFMTSFKIVLLEGTEVVFIVIAVASNTGRWAAAAAGALGALGVVAIAGLILHRPLARVPENTLKFAVGVLLAALGSFWVGEGLGIEWPGADAAIPLLVAGCLVLGLALGAVLRALRRRSPATRAGAPAQPESAQAGAAQGLAAGRVAIIDSLRIAVDLFVDDRALAFGVLVWLALLWFAGTRLTTPPPWQVWIAGLVLVLAYSTLRTALPPRAARA